MKLTKQKLKQIIKEEIKNLNETDNLDTKKLKREKESSANFTLPLVGIYLD